MQRKEFSPADCSREGRGRDSWRAGLLGGRHQTPSKSQGTPRPQRRLLALVPPMAGTEGWWGCGLLRHTSASSPAQSLRRHVTCTNRSARDPGPPRLLAERVPPHSRRLGSGLHFEGQDQREGAVPSGGPAGRGQARGDPAHWTPKLHLTSHWARVGPGPEGGSASVLPGGGGGSPEPWAPVTVLRPVRPWHLVLAARILATSRISKSFI